MHEERAEIEEIEERNKAEATRDTEREGHHHIAEVIDVTSHSPEAAVEQRTRVSLSIAGHVRSNEESRSITKEGWFLAFRATEKVTLPVRPSEETPASEAKDEDRPKGNGRKINRRGYEEGAWQCVDERKPHRVAPSEHPTKVIVRNVDRAEVPILVEEKVENVKKVEKIHSNLYCGGYLKKKR